MLIMLIMLIMFLYCYLIVCIGFVSFLIRAKCEFNLHSETAFCYSSFIRQGDVYSLIIALFAILLPEGKRETPVFSTEKIPYRYVLHVWLGRSLAFLCFNLALVSVRCGVCVLR